MQKIYKGRLRLVPVILIIAVTLQVSCKKDWLEAKPDKSLVVPSTIKDYQALLDNTATLGGGLIPFNANQNSMGEISVGDFYSTNWSSQIGYYQKAYIWAPDIFAGFVNMDDWNTPYTRVFYTNVVLEGIEKITPVDNAERTDWNNVKGAALFLRAYNHYDIAQEFCKPYDKNTAGTDLGIPLRLTPDFNAPSKRGTVQQTYDQIIQDLKAAKELLPVSLPSNILYKNRPTITATNAMLARVYLSMGDYENAFQYADASLNLYNSLISYDSLYNKSPSSTVPFPSFHSEVIWNNTLINSSIFFGTSPIVDSNLYRSYDNNDVRKNIYYRSLAIPGGSKIVWKGSYAGGSTKFSGLATDEVFLIRAECYARKGNKDAAIQDLNTLMQKRWKPAFWIPFTATDADDALVKILTERRKEIIYRGLRWTDLRRLNKEQRFAVTLMRVVNNQPYTLPPNDPRYVLPIPDDAINLGGIEQNPRQ